MNRYKVTTEITIEVRADSEQDATEYLQEELLGTFSEKELSGYYEVEEVID